VMGRAADMLDWLTEQHMGERPQTEWDLDTFRGQILHHFGVDCVKGSGGSRGKGLEAIRERLTEILKAKYGSKEAKIGPEMMRQQVRFIALSIIDARWKDHLLAMDHLKEGIGLR